MAHIDWTEVISNTVSASTSDFWVRHPRGEVPGALWLPATDTPKALILAGHGGSRHKRTETILNFAKNAVEHFRFAVAAIDGPVHGARRGARSTNPAETQKEFLNLWANPGNGIASMVGDWRASLTALQETVELKGLPVGYYGLSMGTAYGLPLLAADPCIDAAVIGMWGSNYPNSTPLVKAARKVRCPVYFMHKTGDDLFTLEGALEIYNALPGDDKRLLLLPGPHTEATPEQIETALAFFNRRLTSR